MKGLHPILIVTGFSLKDGIVKFGVGIDHAFMLKLILQDRMAMDLCYVLVIHQTFVFVSVPR